MKTSFRQAAAPQHRSHPRGNDRRQLTGLPHPDLDNLEFCRTLSRRASIDRRWAIVVSAYSWVVAWCKAGGNHAGPERTRDAGLERSRGFLEVPCAWIEGDVQGDGEFTVKLPDAVRARLGIGPDM
jgi:hypothetical protein